MISKCKQAFGPFRKEIDKNALRIVVRRDTQEVYDIAADVEFSLKVIKMVENYYKKCLKEGKVITK